MPIEFLGSFATGEMPSSDIYVGSLFWIVLTAWMYTPQGENKTQNWGESYKNWKQNYLQKQEAAKQEKLEAEQEKDSSEQTSKVNWLTMLAVLMGTVSATRTSYVKPHFRKNGTFVSGHFKRYRKY
ncbi:hypothetical protein LEP3755_49850 [Leptolyngbya sp. NIES-3755]|nr:hypothetical protein LEP3755_49850 [Leptolyngbya sp. NIES-3755]